MPLLCILDLSHTSVRELPNSFFELEQLRELYMKSCECFMKLSSEVRKLKNLEKIDLDKTQITHLPKEIQELTNLQSLTLCLYEYRGKKSKEYTSSTIIPSGVISKLKGLKHLSIDVNPDDERWEENLLIILPEVSVLECLQTISLYIPKGYLLNLIPARIFELDFRFIVGKHMSRIISGTLPTAEEKFKQSEKSLKFVNGVDVPYEITSAVRHSKALFLDRHVAIKDLSKFGMMSLEQLQVCVLAECKEMQTIVDGRCSISKDILPRLLVLSVSYMKNLRSICEGEVHSSHSFGMLKTLALHNCPKLKIVFTLDFLGNLSLLKDLVIKDCPKVSSLISCGPSKLRAGTFLPKLRTMVLFHLPELITISNGLHVGPTLEKIGIYACPKLQRFSKMDLSSPNLKLIKGQTEWWVALSWSGEKSWGEPLISDCIFSPFDKEADIMSQMELDNDIDDNPVSEPQHSSNSKVSKDISSVTIGETEGETLQSSSGKVYGRYIYEMLNTITKGVMADEPLQPSNDEVFKDKTSYWKRRSSPRWTKISKSLDDGFSWKKYGQKEILGAKFPREYYRCDHRHVQGCLATKQVQRVDEDPSLYDVTYRDRHTCTRTSTATDSSMNNQVDLRTQSGLDDDDTQYHLALQPSSSRIMADQKQIGSNWVRDTSIQASCVTNSTRRVIPKWTIKSKSLDDGFSWKKYGQKEILGAKFPREYYRCYHRHVQGCLATKQVQRVDEDPSLYDVTYRDRHTCTRTSTATDSSMNNQVDLRTQSGLDDDDTQYHLALQPSSSRIIADQKQTGSNWVSDTSTPASCVTNSTDSQYNSDESLDWDLGVISDFWTQPSVHDIYDYSGDSDLESFPFKPSLSSHLGIDSSTYDQFDDSLLDNTDCWEDHVDMPSEFV